MTSPFIWLQHLLPHHAVSRMAGKLASSEVPWLRDRLIRRFIAAYDVDMSEAARGVGEFTSFNDFKHQSEDIEQKVLLYSRS